MATLEWLSERCCAATSRTQTGCKTAHTGQTQPLVQCVVQVQYMVHLELPCVQQSFVAVVQPTACRLFPVTDLMIIMHSSRSLQLILSMKALFHCLSVIPGTCTYVCHPYDDLFGQ